MSDKLQGQLAVAMARLSAKIGEALEDRNALADALSALVEKPNDRRARDRAVAVLVNVRIKKYLGEHDE